MNNSFLANIATDEYNCHCTSLPGMNLGPFQSFADVSWQNSKAICEPLRDGPKRRTNHNFWDYLSLSRLPVYVARHQWMACARYVIKRVTVSYCNGYQNYWYAWDQPRCGCLFSLGRRITNVVTDVCDMEGFSPRLLPVDWLCPHRLHNHSAHCVTRANVDSIKPTCRVALINNRQLNQNLCRRRYQVKYRPITISV